jgi:hypothetical protein
VVGIGAEGKNQPLRLFFVRQDHACGAAYPHRRPQAHQITAQAQPRLKGVRAGMSNSPPIAVENLETHHLTPSAALKFLASH